MEKIMFDSNAFDKLKLENDKLPSWFEKTTEKYEYYLTTVQVIEMADIPDARKDARIHNFLVLCAMRPHLVTSIPVLGHFVLGMSHFPNQEESNLFNNITSQSKAYTKDAIIAAAALEKSLTVITDDHDFINKLEKNNIPHMNFQEWYRPLEQEYGGTDTVGSVM